MPPKPDGPKRIGSLKALPSSRQGAKSPAQAKSPQGGKVASPGTAKSPGKNPPKTPPSIPESEPAQEALGQSTDPQLSVGESNPAEATFGEPTPNDSKETTKSDEVPQEVADGSPPPDGEAKANVDTGEPDKDHSHSYAGTGSASEEVLEDQGPTDVIRNTDDSTESEKPPTSWKEEGSKELDNPDPGSQAEYQEVGSSAADAEQTDTQAKATLDESSAKVSAGDTETDHPKQQEDQADPVSKPSDTFEESESVDTAAIADQTLTVAANNSESQSHGSATMEPGEAVVESRRPMEAENSSTARSAIEETEATNVPTSADTDGQVLQGDVQHKLEDTAVPAGSINVEAINQDEAMIPGEPGKLEDLSQAQSASLSENFESNLSTSSQNKPSGNLSPLPASSRRDSRASVRSQGSLRSLVPLPASGRKTPDRPSSSQSNRDKGTGTSAPEKIDDQYLAVIDAGAKLKEFMATVNEEEQDKVVEPLVANLLVPPQVLDLESKVEADDKVLELVNTENLRTEEEAKKRIEEEFKEASLKEGRSELVSDPQGEGNGNKEQEPSKPRVADPSFEGVDRLKVFCGTWNLGGKPCPPAQSLQEWLFPGTFDIYAIGTQECEVPPQATANVQERPRWEAKLSGTLGHEYSIIAKKCLGATHLVCYVRSSLRAKVEDVQVAQVIAGFGNVMANKGGVAVCFDLLSTSFLFVTAHFAAHQKQVQARNSNFERIDAGLVPLLCPVIAATNDISKAAADPDVVEANPQSPASGSKASWSCSSLFDRVFWMGDFNYRLDASFEVVVGKLKAQQREELLDHDQLKNEMKKGTVFRGFEEPPLAFDPTYKYMKYSNEYDSKKKRTPSWTDRILFRPPPGQKTAIRCTGYTSISSIQNSDHRPVAGHFEVAIKAPETSANQTKESRALGSDSKTQSNSSACAIL